MRGFLIYSLVAIVQCRHEAGYNYRQPNLGGIHGGGGNSGGSFSSSTGSFQQIGSISSAGSSSLGGSSFGGTSFGGTTGGGHFGHGGSGISSGGLIGSTGIGSAGYVSGSSGSASLGQFGGTVSSGGGGFVSGGSTGFAQGPALVQKHIYVHVPPPEPQESFPQRQVSVGVAQKHYKIIFIKAPSAPSLSQQQIALAGQNQEKTIVYVLVKKPDDIGDIAIPTIAPTQPSKPEVYFIKYKAQKQASGTGGGTGIIGAISTGGSSISGPGGLIGTTSIGSGTTIVGGGSHHHGHGGLSSTSSGIGGISSSAISSGSASSSVGGIPAAQYGPPGQSGPY